MKKVIAGAMTIILTLLGFIGLSFATLTPASAGLPEKVTYCQAEGNGTWHPITTAKNALLDKDGNLKQGGINSNDIVPPFSYNFGGDNVGAFTGQNWPATGGEALIANGCVTPESVVDPPVAVYTPGTCAVPNGSVSYTLTNGSILSDGPNLIGSTWTIDFDAAEGFKYADGVTGTQTFPVVGPGPDDEFWDTEKGACNLPDTGLFGLSDELTYVGGGLIALGLAFVIGNAILRRRVA